LKQENCPRPGFATGSGSTLADYSAFPVPDTLQNIFRDLSTA
jgi:hypothetical protein